MSQLSKDFEERIEFWEDIENVIQTLNESDIKGAGLQADLVIKIKLIRDCVDVMALRTASNAFNESIEKCWDRKLLSKQALENLTDLFEDAMAIELGVFDVVEIYNENDDTVH